MAAEGGGSADDLSAGERAVVLRSLDALREASAPLVRREGVARRLFELPFEFDFFQAVRVLHQIFPDRVPVGRGGPAAEEPVRFRGLVSFSFPPSTIQDLTVPTVQSPVPLLTQAFFGLYGPSGILPRHYTELLIRLQRDTRGIEQTLFRDWLDLFNHRLLALFFRAWERYRFHLHFERGEHDRDEPDSFTRVLMSLIGLGTPALRDRLVVTIPAEQLETRPARASGRGRGRGRAYGRRAPRVVARADDLALFYYGGFLLHRPRNAVSLEALLSDFFNVPAKVSQFRGQWLRLEPEVRTALDGGENACLESTAVVGEQVWSAASKILVRLGPLSYSTFLDLLPDPAPIPERKGYYLFSHLARLYAGEELDIDVQLVLRADEVPFAKLEGSDEECDGPGSRLGWNAWILSEPIDRDTDDAVFAVEAVTHLGGAVSSK